MKIILVLFCLNLIPFFGTTQETTFVEECRKFRSAKCGSEKADMAIVLMMNYKDSLLYLKKKEIKLLLGIGSDNFEKHRKSLDCGKRPFVMWLYPLSCVLKDGELIPNIDYETGTFMRFYFNKFNKLVCVLVI